MRISISRLVVVAVGFALALASPAMAADQPYVGLTRQMAGHYDAVAGPGNKLRVIVQPARPFVDERRLTVTV